MKIQKYEFIPFFLPIFKLKEKELCDIELTKHCFVLETRLSRLPVNIGKVLTEMNVRLTLTERFSFLFSKITAKIVSKS